MARTEAKRRADIKWRAEKMHRIAIDCTLRDYDLIAAAAAAAGDKVGTFCRRAIMTAAGILEEDPPEDDRPEDLQRAPFVPDP